VGRDALERRFDGNETAWRRFTLNQWVDALAASAIVPLETWARLAAPHAERPDSVVLGLDVAPMDRGAAIVAVGERDGDLWGTVLEAGVGTDWVIPTLSRLVAKYGRTVVADERRVAHMLPELEQATEFGIRTLGLRDVQTASEFFLRLVLAERFHHRGEPELTAALASAAQRQIGDGWGWSRRKSGADISPLCAMTWAVDAWRGSWVMENGGLKEAA